MSELERLDEALRRLGPDDPDVPPVIEGAARKYRDLLANAERVEPDYEAAARTLAWWLSTEEWEDIVAADVADEWKQQARSIVDAAVGGRLLVDPPKEEK